MSAFSTQIAYRMPALWRNRIPVQPFAFRWIVSHRIRRHFQAAYESQQRILSGMARELLATLQPEIEWKTIFSCLLQVVADGQGR